MTTVLPNGEIQSNPRIAYNKGYEKGRADQKKADNEFFNFDGAWELEKQKIREDAIDECKRAIVNTESKVFNPCADKSWNVLTLLADRQFEILNILEQLKEQKNE